MKNTKDIKTRIIRAVVLTNSLFIIFFFAPVMGFLGEIVFLTEGDRSCINTSYILFISAILALTGGLNIQKKPKMSGSLVFISGIIILARIFVYPDHPLCVFFGASFALAGLLELLISFKKP